MSAHSIPAGSLPDGEVSSRFTVAVPPAGAVADESARTWAEAGLLDDARSKTETANPEEPQSRIRMEARV